MDPLVGADVGAFCRSPPGFSLAGTPEAPRRKVEYGTGDVRLGVGPRADRPAAGRGCRHHAAGPRPRRAHRRGRGGGPRAAADLRRVGLGVAPLAADGDEAATSRWSASPIRRRRAAAARCPPRRRASAARRTARPLDPAPALGFSGAGASSRGPLAGMVQLQPVVTSSAAATAAQAAVVPADAIRRFLRQHGVADKSTQPRRPSQAGDAKIAEAKPSVMRVICVRK